MPHSYEMEIAFVIVTWGWVCSLRLYVTVVVAPSAHDGC